MCHSKLRWLHRRTGLWPGLLALLFCLTSPGLLGEDQDPEDRAAGDLEQGESLELSHSFDSLETLSVEFLKRLQEGDRDRITELALTGEEFEEIVYPTLPASQPGSNLSAEFLWKQTLLRSLAGLANTMDHAGLDYEFLSFRAADGKREYDGFSIHRDGRLTVRSEDGVEKEVDLFGSVIEKDGRFKFYSFARN